MVVAVVTVDHFSSPLCVSCSACSSGFDTVFSALPTFGDPCPSSPAAPVEVNISLRCEFPVGPIPLSCTQCVLGEFVCKKNLLLCGSLRQLKGAGFAECFCLGAEEWRDEEKNSRKSGRRSSVRIRRTGRWIILSIRSLSSFHSVSRASQFSISLWEGASDFHSVSSGDPAHDRRATAMLRSHPCTKTGALSPSFPSVVPSSSLLPSTTSSSPFHSHSPFRTSSTSLMSVSSGMGSSSGPRRDRKEMNQVGRQTSKVSRTEKTSSSSGIRSKRALVRTSSTLSPDSGGVGRSRFLAGASLSLPSTSYPPPSSSDFSFFSAST